MTLALVGSATNVAADGSTATRVVSSEPFWPNKYNPPEVATRITATLKKADK
jgi:hypothetical protein